MPGSIRALRRQADPVRGLGRIPLSKARTPGRPQHRTPGTDTLSRQEQQIADTVEAAFNRVPHQTLLDSLERRDTAGYARAVLNALADAQGSIEAALLASFVSSGETSAIDLGRELSRQYRQVGKAEAPSPSEVALRFRFNATDPRATAWAQAEAGRLITNMATSQQEVFRALVEQSFVESRTMGTTASSIFQQLQTVTPSPTASAFADSIGTNLNGLTTRYERAVMNRVAAVADDLADRGVDGVKALERMRKEGDKYATKLRRARSRTIARTERMMAHNQARLLSYQQAIDSGLMSREHSRKVWSTGPFDVCPICVAMSGTEAKVADAFTLPNGAQVQAPPAHPNCRCTLQTRTDTTLYDPPRALGTGEPGDPFRIGRPGFSAEGERLRGIRLPSAPVPTATPAPQPPPPEPAIPPQVTPNPAGPRADDLVTLDSYGLRGNAIRPNDEVADLFEARYRQYADIDTSELQFLEQREIERLADEFFDEEVVIAWKAETERLAREAGFRGVADDLLRDWERQQYLVSNQRSPNGLKEFLKDLPEGVTEDEARAAWLRIEQDFLKKIEESKVSIQVRPTDLSKIVNDGRFKTQFETGTSGGAKDIALRQKEEYRRFGLGRDAPVEQRPIYGHLERPDIPNNAVDQYGSVRVILRDEVRERTTYTNGDSLGGGYFANPVNAPATDYIPTASRRWPPDFGAGYLEAQVHGGVGVDDIAEVIFDTSARTYIEPSKKLLKQLDERGIPYRFVEREGAWKRDTYRTIPNPLA
jgi:hypothetical protein